MYFFQESLKRILTIFAKLNPGIRYVQGMNEVLAPLYYVFKNDPDQSNSVSSLNVPICLKKLFLVFVVMKQTDHAKDCVIFLIASNY